MRAAGARRWKCLGDVALAQKFVTDSFAGQWGGSTYPSPGGEFGFQAGVAFGRQADVNQGLPCPGSSSQNDGMQGNPSRSGTAVRLGETKAFAGSSSQQLGAGVQGESTHSWQYVGANLRQGVGFSTGAGPQQQHLGATVSGQAFQHGPGNTMQPNGGYGIAETQLNRSVQQSDSLHKGQFTGDNVASTSGGSRTSQSGIGLSNVAGTGDVQFPDPRAFKSHLLQQGYRPPNAGAYTPNRGIDENENQFRPSNERQNEAAARPHLQNGPESHTFSNRPHGSANVSAGSGSWNRAEPQAQSPSPSLGGVYSSSPLSGPSIDPRFDNPVPSARPHESGRSAPPFIQDVVKGLSRGASGPPPSEQSIPPASAFSLQGSASAGVQRKVLARLTNYPKFALRSDIISYFEGCNLKAEDVEFVYDDNYRPRFIHLEFDSEDNFQNALKTVSSKGRFGGKFMKLEKDSPIELDIVNHTIQSLQGHGLLVQNLGSDVLLEDVDRFFQGYGLGLKSVKMMRSTLLPGWRQTADKRAIVKFDSYLSASRALREKQGQFCRDRPVDLRYLQ